MSARPRAGSLFFEESEGLYETCFCFCGLGSFGAPSLVSVDELGILWELMALQPFSAQTLWTLAEIEGDSQQNLPDFGPTLASVVRKLSANTTYRSRLQRDIFSHSFPRFLIPASPI
jgi:hypothetical protein